MRGWGGRDWIRLVGMEGVRYFNAIEIKGPKTKPEDGLCHSFLFLLFFFIVLLGYPPTLCLLGLIEFILRYR